MTNWLKRAGNEISKMSKSYTAVTDVRKMKNLITDDYHIAITDERNLMSVMAVSNLDKSEKSTFSATSIVGNGSTSMSHLEKNDQTHEDGGIQKQKSSFWNTEEEMLIKWFLSTKDLPTSPFQLKQAIYVIDTNKFYKSIQADIDEGCKGARALFGALQDDLRCLKKIINTLIKE